jgi:hypothetical protein
VTGLRSTYWINNVASDTHTIYYYLNTGITAAPDHVIYGRLDKFPSNYKVKVESSTDASAWTTETTSARISTLTLIGPDATDYIVEFTASASRRYWRVRFFKDVNSDDNIYIGKIYLGNFFDWGVEPDDYSINRIPESQSNFYYGAGSQKITNLEDSVYQININWLGVTDDKVKDFYDKIVKYKHINPVFLYARSVAEVLDSQTLIHCRLISCSTEQVGRQPDYNLVRATFEQVLG